MKIKSSQVLILSCLLGLSSAAESVRRFSVVPDARRGGAVSSEGRSVRGAVTVVVHLQQSLSNIGPHFVGVTLDASLVRLKWSSLDFSSKKVQNMARALTPTYFRLGGTTADVMNYDLRGANHDSTDLHSIPHFNMTADLWEAVNNFSRTVGWDFIMDLNALKRNTDGSWNPDNARELLQFSAARNYTIAGFELGNEYDFYQHQFNRTVSPAQLAKDVATLQKVLSEFPQYYSAFIVGPEAVHALEEYFQGFLEAGGSRTVRAATFHQYYFAGADRNLSHFTDIKVMDSLADTLDNVMAESRSVDPQLPVWLSETSSAYDGGAVNMSDRFVAGFLWLDKLGMCAARGVQTVLRQDFYGGNYALIDYELNPNPDFWLTVLYKRIVGGPVFSAIGRLDVRVYAACANTNSFRPGGVVVYILNPNNYPVTFDLPQFESQPRLIYALTAGDSEGLVSRYMSLNGVRLELVDDELPPLKPLAAPPGMVTSAPYSFTFVVFDQARASVCLEPR